MQREGGPRSAAYGESENSEILPEVVVDGREVAAGGGVDVAWLMAWVPTQL